VGERYQLVDNGAAVLWTQVRGSDRQEVTDVLASATYKKP